MLGLSALGEKGSRFASFNKGFGIRIGLREAHIMAGWSRGSIFIWRAVCGFLFRGRLARGRVWIFFVAGAVYGFFRGAGWLGPCMDFLLAAGAVYGFSFRKSGLRGPCMYFMV